jgi:hypothetical protein
MLLPIHHRFEQKAWERSHLNWMTYLDLNIRLPELLLMRVDKMAMGVGRVMKGLENIPGRKYYYGCKTLEIQGLWRNRAPKLTPAFDAHRR